VSDAPANPPGARIFSANMGRALGTFLPHSDHPKFCKPRQAKKADDSFGWLDDDSPRAGKAASPKGYKAKIAAAAAAEKAAMTAASGGGGGGALRMHASSGTAAAKLGFMAGAVAITGGPNPLSLCRKKQAQG